MNGCHTRCDKKFNPKQKEKISYYEAQDLWECKQKCKPKNIAKSTKNKKKSTKKRK